MASRNGGPRLDGVRVLVVDDSPEILDIVAEILRHAGVTVTAVGCADKALAVLQDERPHVLLSDLTMRGRSGFWLIGQVRALPPERGGATPAAALTVDLGPEHRTSVLGAGFQAHVEKLEELVGVVTILVACHPAATGRLTTELLN